MDQRLLERREQRTLRSTRSTESPCPRTLPRDLVPYSPAAAPQSLNPEPMELSRLRLSATDRKSCFQEHLCLYCGASGHVIQACPLRPKDRAHQGPRP